MAWDKTLPTNSGLLINAPAQIRANWEALEALTTAALQITDAKVAVGAAIQEAKLLFAADGHGHTGGTDGKEITLPFQTGDWILSSVTTARTGWTNVTATYNTNFIRIGTTPLATGGANTHTHAAGTYAAAAHNHKWYDEKGASTTDQSYNVSGAATNLSIEAKDSGSPVHIVADNTAGTDTFADAWTDNATPSLSGSSASANNVPVYRDVTVFQKD